MDRTGRGMKGFDSFTRLRTSIFALPAGDAMGVPSATPIGTGAAETWSLFLINHFDSESALSNYLVSKRLLFPRVRYAIVNWGFIANPELVVTYVDDHPTKEELRHGELDVVMSGPYPKWAVFLCPCGCGDAIDISIAKGTKSWRLEVDPIGRPSLYPSVWRHDRCLSHFWVRRGEVFWCKSLGQSASSPATGRTGRIRKLGNWIRSRVWPG